MMPRLDRRTVLRGLGAAVGLPLLEAMVDNKALAQGMGAPTRYAIVFAGQSIGGDGWAKDAQMIGGRRFTEAGHFVAPAATGRAYTMTTPLSPLMALKDDYSIVSNLAIPFSRNSTDASAVPPGGAFREFHGGGKSPLISGMRSTQGSFRANGITSDQVIARMRMGQTTHESLVYRAQPSWYLSGSSFAGRQYLSYKSESERIEAQTSPQLAFRSLFQGFVPGGERERAVFDFEQRKRLSVLDLVADKRQLLVGRVGAADRARLDRHIDEILALEQRVMATPPATAGECRALCDPGADPSI